MRKLIPVRRLLDDAERDGFESANLWVDPEDIVNVDPSDLDDLDSESYETSEEEA